MFFNPNSNLGLGLKITLFALLSNFFECFLFFSKMLRPAEVYPNGPDVIIMSFIFAPFLLTIFSVIPNKEKLMTSSFPSFVSPPNIFR